MVNKNIQMKKREGNQWDNLFPITLADNIFNNDGEPFNVFMAERVNQLRSDVTEEISDVENEINTLMNQMVKIINPTMTTKQIQDLLDEGGEFKFTSGNYLIDLDSDGVGLDIKDDTTINFETGAFLMIDPTSLDDYRIVNIEKRENITLRGLVVYGDKHTHLGSGGEWGHGISIRASNNIKIYDSVANRCWGDGLYIGQATDYSIDYCEDITIENFKADDNRRQGMSVTSVSGLYMKNLRLTNTSGTLPEAGIDLEPNNNRNRLDNIIIDGVYTENNSAGVEIHIANFGGNNWKNVSITVNDHESFEDSIALECRGYTDIDSSVLRGRITINNPLWQNNGYNAMIATWVNYKEIMLVVNNPKIINPNTNGSSTVTTGACIRLTGRDSSHPIGNVIINNLDLTHPDTSPTMGLMMDSADRVENFHFYDPISFGEFESFRCLFGQYSVTDPKRLLKRTPSSSTAENNVGNNYSSIYSSINRDGGARYYLENQLEVGMADITFIAENGDMNIYPDDNEIILPYGEVGQPLRVETGGTMVLRKTKDDTWQIINEVGNITPLDR